MGFPNPIFFTSIITQMIIAGISFLAMLKKRKKTPKLMTCIGMKFVFWELKSNGFNTHSSP